MEKVTSLEYDKADSENIRQEKNGILVDREIYCNFSCAMQELQEKEIISFEDIENQTLTDEQIKKYNPLVKTDKDLNEFRENGEDTQEIYEYWIVSEYFFNKLKEINEPVIEWGNLYIWGRTCTGQSIALDYTIDEIRKLMK